MIINGRMSTQLPGQIKAYTITVQFCSIIHLQAQADHASKTKSIDTHSHQKKCCVMDFPTVCGLCPYSIEPIPKLNSVRNGNKIDICVQDNINERYRKSKCDMTPFCFQNGLNMVTHLPNVAINLFHWWLFPGIEHSCSKLLNSTGGMCEIRECS